MKKLLALLLAVVMLVSLCSCVKVETSKLDEEKSENSSKSSKGTDTEDSTSTSDESDVIAEEDAEEEFELIGIWQTEYRVSDMVNLAADTGSFEGQEDLISLMFDGLELEHEPILNLEFYDESTGKLYFDEESFDLFYDDYVNAMVERVASVEFLAEAAGISEEEALAVIESQGMSMEDYKESVRASMQSSMSKKDLKESMSVGEAEFTYSFEDNKVTISSSTSIVKSIIYIENDTLRLTERGLPEDLIFTKKA